MPDLTAAYNTASAIFGHAKTAGRIAYNGLSYYLRPKSSRGLAAILLAHQLVISFGIGGSLYPNAEEALEALGISEQSAKKITPFFPSIVRPVPQDREELDRVYNMLSLPLYTGVLFSTYREQFPSSGATVPLLVCDITSPKEEKFDAIKSMATYWANIRPESMRPLPVSDQEILAFILMHEIAHCGPEKIPEGIFLTLYSMLPYKLQNLIGPVANWVDERVNHEERQADLSAIKTIAQDSGRDQIAQFVLYARAIQAHHLVYKDVDTNHDLVLYIDAYLQGKSPPSIEDVQDSRNEIVDQFNKIFKSMNLPEAKIDWLSYYVPSYEDRTPKSDDKRILTIRIADQIRREDQNLSPLARRRLDLFIDGMAYFSPKVVSEALHKKVEPPPSAISYNFS